MPYVWIIILVAILAFLVLQAAHKRAAEQLIRRGVRIHAQFARPVMEIHPGPPSRA